MNVLIWTYLIRYISITKKKKNKEGKHTLKRNDNTKQHRWKSREIKVILKTSQNVVTQRSTMWPTWRSSHRKCIGILICDCLSSPVYRMESGTRARGGANSFRNGKLMHPCVCVQESKEWRNRWTFTFNFAFLFNVLHFKAAIKIHTHTHVDTQTHCTVESRIVLFVESFNCWGLLNANYFKNQVFL